MKNTNLRNLVAITLAALILTLPVVPVSAQESFTGPMIADRDSIPSTAAVSAVSTDVGILIRFVGQTGGGTVTVAAGGDISLATGAVGASTADATVECPVSGAAGGIIDVSDTACDTLGEVVDVINSSTQWRAVLLDGLRSDSSNNTLITLSETAANGTNGLGLLRDGTVSFTLTAAVVPPEMRRISAYIEGGPGSATKFQPNPFIGNQSILWALVANSTYGSGTSTINIYSVAVTNGTATTGTSASGTTNASETVTTLWSSAGGATTASATLDANNFPYGIRARRGEKLVVRITNSAAMSAGTLYAYGTRTRYK